MVNLTHPAIIAAEITGGLRAEPEPVLCCEYCGDGIYDGDRYYSIEGMLICESCIDLFSQVAIRQMSQ